MLTYIFTGSRLQGGKRRSKESNQVHTAIFQAMNLNITGDVFWKNQSSYFCFTIKDRKLRGKILIPDDTFYFSLRKNFALLRIVKHFEWSRALLGDLMPSI